MRTGLFAAMGIIIIALLSTLVFFQVKQDQEAPLSDEKVIEVTEYALGILTALAQADVEGRKYDEAAMGYENASTLFVKLQAKAWVSLTNKAFRDGEPQKEKVAAIAAGDALVRAGDMLVEAANAWILAGKNDKAAKAYKAAMKCYQESMASYVIAGDVTKEAVAVRLHNHAEAQAAALGQ